MRRTPETKSSQGFAALEVAPCTFFTMLLIKFIERGAPVIAVFVTAGPLGLLINEPPEKPFHKRTARWVDPAKVWIEWLRHYLD